MNPWIALVTGIVIGAVVAFLLLRSTYAVRAASAATERDLLRERVVDLEASLAEDLETASLLAPLRDALGRVEHQVGVLERDRVEQFGALRAVMGRVESEAQHLGRQTQSLAGSLRSSSVRGSWGEVQLHRVLEASGMLARCDFEEQVRARSRHDRDVRPDVVVRLPGGRSLVIDAKAPMSAFLDAQTEDLADDERTQLLREHATALRQHVHALSAKDYWSAFDSSPEMVVCFVPSDAMLAAALAADPGLHERAMTSRVVLVGPGALLALLRTVAFGWQQDSLSTSARELLALGQELYKRLSTLGTHAAKMGRSLHATVESYNQFVGALESRVLVTARRMQELDVVSDELPHLVPVETGPRVLTAIELLEAVGAEDERPDLLFDAPAPEPAHRLKGDDRAV
ncbi:DNA recombination protein RmuC [Knoellia sp. CPCC 206435]|uniref:DNA recombination protein RmuC n=1 Tax=Knoellia terrae TaxID=3404797 RepID=UPI003B43702A